MQILYLSLRISWIGLLLLPNLSTIAFANAWDIDANQLFVVSLWVTVFMYSMIPQRWFPVVTLPIVVAGAVVLGADFLRSVNIFDLIAVSYTFKSGEVMSALRPYLGIAIFTLIPTLALTTIMSRIERISRGRQLSLKIGVVSIGLILVLAVQNSVWLSAWPVVLVPTFLASQSHGVGIELPNRESVRITPRDRFRSWNAKRTENPTAAETYIFIIGESVRSDRINGCGGRSQTTAPPSDSLIYCDVLSGSSSTHTSVPLLVSRELPGHSERVSRDSTFLNAFEAVGFETFWLAVQERSIAWPDAKNQVYDASSRLDRDVLLPLLDTALSKPARKKIIILHAYNSHFPYTDRYQATAAPFAVDMKFVGSQVPTQSAIGDWWNAYDNSVDESMHFLDAVVDRLRMQSGEAFLIFTSDHGENMIDDKRNLIQHALKVPTVWDTKVPSVVWGNTAWRQAYPVRWEMLSLNKNMPIMHMDLVPTMLGAAGITYTEQRGMPIDLTVHAAGSIRSRITQVRTGESVSSDMLYKDAETAKR